MVDPQNWLQVARSLALTLEPTLLEQSQSAIAEIKTDGSLVTSADRWADETICATLRREFPTYGILAEESHQTLPDTDFCWVIDPIDGTTNFARGIPAWGVSIGLLYCGTPVFGFIHLPPLQQTFHGYYSGTTGLELPNGSWLNDRPIHASREPLTGQHFFSVCTRSIEKIVHPFPCKIRMLGAATYNFLTVALGSCLGAVEATPKLWDIAAAWAIVRASGATWQFLGELATDEVFPLTAHRDYLNQAFPSIIVARSELLDQFTPQINL